MKRKPVRVKIDGQKVKSVVLLCSFAEHCRDNPDQRFWQALRNWSGFYSIYGQHSEGDIKDTYYFDGKAG